MVELVNHPLHGISCSLNQHLPPALFYPLWQKFHHRICQIHQILYLPCQTQPASCADMHWLGYLTYCSTVTVSWQHLNGGHCIPDIYTGCLVMLWKLSHLWYICFKFMSKLWFGGLSHWPVIVKQGWWNWSHRMTKNRFKADIIPTASNVESSAEDYFWTDASSLTSLFAQKFGFLCHIREGNRQNVILSTQCNS